MNSELQIFFDLHTIRVLLSVTNKTENSRRGEVVKESEKDKRREEFEITKPMY